MKYLSRLTALLMGALIAISVASRTHAENILAADPDGVFTYFKDNSFPSRLTTDAVDDPLVQVKYLDTVFDVYFYGCVGNTNCQSVQFHKGYATDGTVTMAQTNAWNADTEFTHAYVTEDENVRLEFDVYTGNAGLLPYDFSAIVAIWLDSLTEFEKHIE
jgi:hypothetical protein